MFLLQKRGERTARVKINGFRDRQFTAMQQELMKLQFVAMAAQQLSAELQIKLDAAQGSSESSVSAIHQYDSLIS
jgi:hypothetical protein